MHRKIDEVKIPQFDPKADFFRFQTHFQPLLPVAKQPPMTQFTVSSLLKLFGDKRHECPVLHRNPDGLKVPNSAMSLDFPFSTI